jgi:hypothetical protein
MGHQLWTTLLKHNISPNQLYLLDCCRRKTKPGLIINEDAEFNICQAKGFIDPLTGTLTSKALVLLEDFETLLVKTKKKVASDVLGGDFLDYIKKYRELFPATRLPSGELARQSVQELKDKFIWFFKTYPEYSWTQVIDAAYYYVYKKTEDDFKFMSTSSYFIQKTDIKSKTVKSLLADYCQLLIDNADNLDNI